MTMPRPGPEGPGASVAGGTSFVVFRDSEHKDAAWKLVAYLSDPEVQARFHGMTGNLPPRRSPWKDPALANDPYARRSEEHTSELQSLMRISYAVFCLKKKITKQETRTIKMN